MTTYVSIGLELQLTSVKFKDGKLHSGYVINGAWRLQRVGDNWTVSGKKIIRPCKDTDFILVTIPNHYEHLYNDAISYALLCYKSPCKGCGRLAMHKMCPAHGTSFYMSGVPYTEDVEECCRLASGLGVSTDMIFKACNERLNQ